MAGPVNNFNGIADLNRKILLDHGNRFGRVNRGEVFELVPEAEFDDGLKQEVLDGVSSAGIPYDDGGGEEIAVDEAALGEAEPIQLGHDGVDIPQEIESDNILRIYFQEASHVPLLTAAQEVDLARQIEACRKAQEELKQGSVSPERREHLQQVIERGRAARDHLVMANMRLVLSVARRYYGYGLPLLDLIQEGNIGLMRAIRNYDYRRGYKFSTYATWWIRQAISRALADQGRMIRLPAYMSDQVNRMVREQRRLEQELGREPSSEELAQALQLSPETVNQMKRNAQQPISLQTPVGEDSEEELGDILQDTSSAGPEDEVVQALNSEDVQRKLDSLPPRERQVLELRYGLGGEAPMTLQGVGERMGITRERARQLEIQALGRLRNPEASSRRRGRPREPG